MDTISWPSRSGWPTWSLANSRAMAGCGRWQAASRGNSRFEYCNAWQSACVRRWAAASGRADRAGRGLPRFNPGCDTNHGALQVLPLADDHARRPLHHGQRLAREQGLDHESDCKCPALPTSGSARSLFCARCVRAAQPPGACLRSKQQVVHACPSHRRMSLVCQGEVMCPNEQSRSTAKRLGSSVCSGALGAAITALVRKAARDKVVATARQPVGWYPAVRWMVEP